MSALLHVVLEVALFVALVYGAVKIFAGVMSAAFPGLAAASRKSVRGTRTALNSPAPLAVRRQAGAPPPRQSTRPDGRSAGRPGLTSAGHGLR